MVCYEDRWRQKHAVGYVTSWRKGALGDSDSERAMAHEEASLLDRVAEHGRIDACRPWTWTLADTLILIPIESFSRLGPLFSS